MESCVSFEEHQQYPSANREYVECFFAGNGLEEEEVDGTADDIFRVDKVRR